MRILGLVTPLSGSVISGPVVCKAVRIWVTLALGAACLRTPHVSVSCGVAIDVTLAYPKPPLVSEESIVPPGAERERKWDYMEREAMTCECEGVHTQMV